jgi:hypothetical protein
MICKRRRQNRADILLIWFGAAVAAGCGSHPQPRVPADLSGPRAAAVTFYSAVVAGDTSTARHASLGTDVDKKWIDAMARLLSGMRIYDQAIVKHFGSEAVQTDTQLKLAMLQLGQDQIDRLQEGVVNQGPEVAQVHPGWHGEVLSARPPIILRKEYKAWKVDLAETAKVDPKFGPDAVNRYRIYGDALHDAAWRINAGRYKTLAQAEHDTDRYAP